jgi:tetratricopeptide (TPR) repeat protein
MTDAVTKLKDNGNLYYKSQEYKKARDCYLKCIELKPEEALYHYNTSMANFQLQKYEESLANCEKAVELDPKYKKAYFRKVQCNLKLGNSLQAIIDGKKYLSLEGAEPQDS